MFLNFKIIRGIPNLNRCNNLHYILITLGVVHLPLPLPLQWCLAKSPLLKYLLSQKLSRSPPNHADFQLRVYKETFGISLNRFHKSPDVRRFPETSRRLSWR